MVTRRVTIKGFAYAQPSCAYCSRSLACLCFAQDYHPLGDHGNPKGYNQGLRPCMQGHLKSSILTALDQALLKSSILTACMQALRA